MGAIETWTSEAPADREATVARVQAHDAVVSAALATGRTPLPARFGQRFADGAALARELEQMAPTLLHTLERLSGLVEMSVVIAPERARRRGEAPPKHIDAGEPGAGHRYLEALRRRANDSERTNTDLQAAADRLLAAVRGISMREVRDTGRHDAPALGVAHLISREAIETFRAAVAPLDRSAGWRFLVSGPRAPYSFSSVPERT